MPPCQRRRSNGGPTSFPHLLRDAGRRRGRRGRCCGRREEGKPKKKKLRLSLHLLSRSPFDWAACVPFRRARSSPGRLEALKCWPTVQREHGNAPSPVEEGEGRGGEGGRRKSWRMRHGLPEQARGGIQPGHRAARRCRCQTIGRTPLAASAHWPLPLSLPLPLPCLLLASHERRWCATSPSLPIAPSLSPFASVLKWQPHVSLASLIHLSAF